MKMVTISDQIFKSKVKKKKILMKLQLILIKQIYYLKKEKEVIVIYVKVMLELTV